MSKGIYERTELHKQSRLGTGNPNYKGSVGYEAIHNWARKNLPAPKKCHCGSVENVDASNKDNKYIRDLLYWHWECRKCHMEGDGRSEQLRQSGKSRRLPDKICPECKTVFHTDKRSQVNCSHKCGHKAMWRKRKENK